mmetsp:Transcript_37992/g.58802  ORF Transcript_37992/g.58802 Transcript_37992/m.58802 type:complete len:302 (+) Transcript_37992:34-939(+)
MEEFAKHSTVMFHPRKSLPDGYFPVTKMNKVVFTFRLIPCKSYQTKNTIVFFHGNGEIVEDYIGSDLEKHVTETMNLCMVEYRGYGYFSEFSPNVVKMMQDVILLQQTLARNYRIKEENTIVMGRSIGSLFAAEYCNKFPNIAGIIIESGFNSAGPFYMERIKKKKNKLNEETFKAMSEAAELSLDNARKMKAYQGPVLVYHGNDDHIVPVSNGELLFSSLTTEDKTLCIFDMGRHSVSVWNSEEYFATFNKFTNKIFPGEEKDDTNSQETSHQQFNNWSFICSLAVGVVIGALAFSYVQN